MRGSATKLALTLLATICLIRSTSHQKRTFAMITVRALVFSILVGILAASPSSVRAQESTYKLGVQGGLSSMTYGGENVGDAWNSRRGISAGAVFTGHYDIGYLQAGLKYVQKGAKTTVNQVTVTEKLEYVSIPVLAKLQIPISRAVTPNLFGGFVSSFAVGAQREFKASGETDTETISPDNVPVTEWSLAFGVGVDIGAYAPITLMLDARYMYGLNSAPSSLGNTSFQGASFRNQGFTVNAGLAFSL